MQSKALFAVVGTKSIKQIILCGSGEEKEAQEKGRKKGER